LTALRTTAVIDAAWAASYRLHPRAWGQIQRPAKSGSPLRC